SGVAYLTLADGSLWSVRLDRSGSPSGERLTTVFGPVDRGFFLLPKSRHLVGLAADGTVSLYRPHENDVTRVKGPVPLAAGPAIDPTEDAWYFADRRVVRYTLTRPGP